MVDINPKLPKHCWDDKEVVPKYGTITGWRGHLGECKFTYSNPDEPDKYSWQKIEPTGSMTTFSMDPSEEQNVTSLNVGNKFGYTTDGESKQVDGHTDSNTEATSRKNNNGDCGESCQKKYELATQGVNRVSGEVDLNFTVAASESWSASGTYGDQVNEHSGHWHEAFEKDRVTAVKKNDVLMIGDGDYACHVQSGNWDTHIKSKARMYADSDILIESKTKIVLKVGSSTITITPSNIEILASGGSGRIDLNN